MLHLRRGGPAESGSLPLEIQTDNHLLMNINSFNEGKTFKTKYSFQLLWDCPPPSPPWLLPMIHLYIKHLDTTQAYL